jgi:tRNA A58 N-methylase Trm61
MNIDQIEETIEQLRNTARQLNTTADLMEAMVRPWKVNHNMMADWDTMWKNMYTAKTS